MENQIQTVLIVDDVHPLLTDGLGAAGFEVMYRPDIASEDVLELVLSEAISGLVIRSKMHLTEAFFSAAKGTLRWVGRAGAGLDNIDVEAAHNSGVYCFNSGEANSVAVGEQTVGMLLSLLHNLGKANAEVRNGIWDREGNRGVELQQLTVGVLGYGNTGAAVCKRLQGFGCQVIAVDKYKDNFAQPWDAAMSSSFREQGKGEVFEGSLEDLYSHADVLTLHVPLTEETRYFINAKSINRFKKSWWLLNLSRGEVVDTAAVLGGLGSGKILGFAADVLEVEPPFQKLAAFDAMRQFPNVIFSPHVGGWTKESYRKISEVILSKVLAYYGIES